MKQNNEINIKKKRIPGSKNFIPKYQLSLNSSKNNDDLNENKS